MLKVTRTKKPDSLDKNADQWTKELLYEINKQGGRYSKVEDKYKNRYKKADVLNALRKMYKSRCCYCESIFSATSFENIEHLKPKSNPSFYNLTFDWDNLHYCCTVCNINKKAKWDFTNPILVTLFLSSLFRELQYSTISLFLIFTSSTSLINSRSDVTMSSPLPSIATYSSYLFLVL